MSDKLLNDDHFAECPVPAFAGTVQFPDWTLATFRQWNKWVGEIGQLIYPKAENVLVAMGNDLERVDLSGVSIAVQFATIDIDHPKMPASIAPGSNLPVQILPWLADCGEEWAVGGTSFFRHRPARVAVPTGDEEE
jgi:hypothetical protein